MNNLVKLQVEISILEKELSSLQDEYNILCNCMMSDDDDDDNYIESDLQPQISVINKKLLYLYNKLDQEEN